MLAEDVKFISVFIGVGFVIDSLVINVRSLLDALTKGICCFHHLLIFSLGYCWDGCQENSYKQKRINCLAFSTVNDFIVSSFRNLATSAADTLFIPLMEV